MTGKHENRIRTPLQRLFDWLPPLLLCALMAGAALFTRMPPASFFSEYAAAFLCGAFIAFSPVFPANGGIYAGHTLFFGVFFADAALTLAAILGLNGLLGLLCAALVSAALAPACVIGCRLLLRLRADMEALAGIALFFLAMGLCMLPRILGWPAADVRGALDALSALTVIRTAFALVFAAIVVRVALHQKKIPQWDALAVTLAIAGACAAATFLPPVEAALSVNDADLYDILHILLSAAVAYQLVRLFIQRVLAKDGGPLNSAMRTCCLAAVIYVLLALPGAEEAMRAVRLPMASILCVLALLIYSGARAHFFADARGGTARLLSVSRAVLFAAIGRLLYMQYADTAAPALEFALFAAAAVCLGGAREKEGAVLRALLGLAFFSALTVLAPRTQAAYPDFALSAILTSALLYTPIAAALARRGALWFVEHREAGLELGTGTGGRCSFSFYEKRTKKKNKQ